MTFDKPLKYMPNAKARVCRDSSGIGLVSYATHVAHIDKNGYLSIRGKYSITTCRHINAFIKEYAPGLFPVVSVRCWEWLTRGGSINIQTGEVSEWGIWR